MLGAWTLGCAQLPAICSLLDLSDIWLVLAWASLESLRLLECQILALRRANLPRRLHFLRESRLRAVIAGSWLQSLLLGMGVPFERLAHRVLRTIDSGRIFLAVLTGSWRA